MLSSALRARSRPAGTSPQSVPCGERLRRAAQPSRYVDAAALECLTSIALGVGACPATWHDSEEDAVLCGRSTCVLTTTKRRREILAEQHGPAQLADAALLSHSCFSSSRLMSVCARRRTFSAFRLDIPAPLVLPAHQRRVSCRFRRKTCPALAAFFLVRRSSCAAVASRSLPLDRHVRRVAATES